MSSSRRASSPMTRKKKVISPSLTQPRRFSASSAPPIRIESSLSQKVAYEWASTLAQASAAIAPASRTRAPPDSVRRKSRTGKARLRAQAVRPVKDAASACVATATP